MTKKTIIEVKNILENLDTEEVSILKELSEDDRKGVQKLITSWKKKQNEKEQLRTQFYDMMYYEKQAYKQGSNFIAGIDEVGRGPLAGPVVAACVILPKDFYLPGLTDSKKLSKAKREEFYEEILRYAIAVEVGEASSKEIDRFNIYQSSKHAMMRALEKLSQKPDYLLVDAMKLPTSIPQLDLIKGDSRSISIAASSVVAKVTRDRYMEDLHKKYPNYDFNRHMGYGTKVHLEALETYGVMDEHRTSFAPIKQVIDSGS
ncbi:ribonuclease HII [Salipaludibacillus sp. CF4.18]|uniref:ribonuclease HII n=1 Tax=Salipaludibacillus sp. CF4.18 TaxID=3373081 RepID=UPI003EE54833